MKLARLVALACLVSAFTAACSQQSPAARASHLLVTSKPALVDCAPVTQMPCMTMGFTAVDDAGKPAPIALPPQNQLTSILSAQESETGRDVKPFFATAGDGLDAGQHSNVILLMIDTSGSMNDPSPGADSRFAAVRNALTRYVNAMQEGADNIAIVPFESHNVVPTIRSAVFSNHKADVLAQLNALAAPTPKNNTALFQAVFSGVDTLKAEVASLEHDGHTAAELQPHLIVMTDGKNEVFPGDDPLLLNGPLGLQQAAAQVTASHFDVVGVGFGDRAAIDANALQRLSTRFFYASDAEQLLDALHVTHTEQSHVLQMTWLPGEMNRIALAGRDQSWTPTLMTADGNVLRGPSTRLLVPAIAAPLFDRTALPAELVALIATHPPTSTGWSIVLVHLLLFLGALALLLVLWFWVPRLIWGERYLSAATPTRWSSERQNVKAVSAVQIRSMNAPAGFTAEPAAAGPLQRSPAQTTQVGPRPEAARPRLNFD